MEEIWKPIKGFEDKYEVSNLGNVRNNKGLVLKYYIINSGYKALKLFNGAKGKAHLIHRLVAQAFIPNVEGLPMVNHKDSDRFNNTVENLEWVTAQRNIRHAMEAGRHSKMYTNKNSLGKKHLKNTSSKYYNVTYLKDKDRWRAHINIEGLKPRQFDSEYDAALYVNYLIDKYNLQDRPKNDVVGEYNFPPIKNMQGATIENILTGELIRFNTLKSCADYLGVYPSRIQGILKSGKELKGFMISINEQNNEPI